MFYAHSKNSQGRFHNLSDHLNGIAQRASEFAAKFDAGEIAYWAGLWHDIGKFHPDFQSYLNDPKRRHGPDHKSAGAALALRHLEPLAFLIVGHHGGLPNRSHLKNWLKEKTCSQAAQSALSLASQILEKIEPDKSLLKNLPPAMAKAKPLEVEFFLRMLFSALVDADFIDTEKHFELSRSSLRGAALSLSELWTAFESNQSHLTGKKDDRVNLLRHSVYGDCLRAADMPPGFFKLTVPTGGGKTRSAMAFALRHAIKHGLQRIIVAIPYTSIIEQTAEVYREIFGADHAVLEHHSAVAPEEDKDEPLENELWARLASENWDAPIVVTTMVQLFESLFGNRSTQCRKLHNIARSILILDEVQTLPPGLLEPILDALRQLAAGYGSTVVMSTATQPALQSSPYLRGLDDAREIVQNPENLFRELKRVDYKWPKNEDKWTWERVAEEMRSAEQALAVVNTKKDAIELLDALNDPEALHLSTLLCGAHRLDVLKEVSRRIKDGTRCRLVSTQVVEAGIDLDFPFVLRAIGPLDRIVQAAGRCNREGRLKSGIAVVFIPEKGTVPRGAYRTGTDTTLALMKRPNFDFHDPNLYQTYFTMVFQGVELDAKNIQSLRQGFDYPEVAARFRMIDEPTEPVIVRYCGPNGKYDKINKLFIDLNSFKGGNPRWLLRRLQPYMVGVHARLIRDYCKDGLLNQLPLGLWEWLGRYDLVRGLVAENPDPSGLVF